MNALFTKGGNCGFCRSRFVLLRMDAETPFCENIGQRAKYYPVRRADYC
jgi:hypothetical protein